MILEYLSNSSHAQFLVKNVPLFTRCYKSWINSAGIFDANDKSSHGIEFQPDDSRSWESPENADNVWRLFIQILLP